MLTIELVKEKYELLIKQNLKLLDELSQLDGEELSYKTSDHSWNILQVLDHVKNAEMGTLVYIRKKLTYGGLKKVNWSAGLRAMAMKSANNSSFKFKMPKALPQPQAAPSLEAAQTEWGALHGKWKKCLDEYPTEHLDKAIFRHPVFGRLSLLQAVDSMISHHNHHLKQIERIRKQYAKGR